MSNFFEKKATVGASPEEETIVSNVAWTVFGGKWLNYLYLLPPEYHLMQVVPIQSVILVHGFLIH